LVRFFIVASLFYLQRVDGGRVVRPPLLLPLVQLSGSVSGVGQKATLQNSV